MLRGLTVKGRRDMGTDTSLTILLTLKDKVLFTFRWMSYANRINFPFKVLIADGGADETVPEVLSNRANFPNVDYEHVRYPYDQTYTEFYAKVADALSRIETPFVAMADNDDFYIVEGLRRSVDFLRVHPDYSSCRGDVGGFRVRLSEKYGHLSRVYGEDVQFFSKIYHCQSIEDETAKQCVQSHFSCYSPTWYDVHRTEQLIEYFQTLRDSNLKDIYLAELLTSFLTVAAGKVRREPYLYLMRQKNPPSRAARTHGWKWGDFFDRMLLESWSDDFTKFVNAIATAIASEDGISMDDAQRQVKQSYRLYIAPHIIRCLSSRNSEPGNPVISTALSLVRKLAYDSKMRQVLRKLYLGVRRLTRGQFRGNNVISVNRSTEYYKDIKPIIEVVSSRHPAYPIGTQSGKKDYA